MSENNEPPRECGPGWNKLIDPLVERCKAEGVEILQIKEKFGGLRFYVDFASGDLYDAISAAEDESYNICEECGEPGKSYSNHGWLRTCCEAHK